MVSSSFAKTDAFLKFIDEQRLTEGSSVAEIVPFSLEDNPFDPDLKFQDWVVYFIKTAQDRGTLMTGLHAGDIAGLMRKENLETVTKELSLSCFPDADEFRFLTGQYDEIEATGTVILRNPPNVRPSEIRLLWKTRIEACRDLEKFGYWGRDVSSVELAAQVRNICLGIRRYQNHLPNLLLKGEPGTGKELVARAIHHLSGRKEKAFEAVNCAGIPDQLLESELFGHEAGAFTGAVSSREGLILKCHGGTLFLDEVDKMSAHLQHKLLRVLQEREVRPLGSNETKKVDFLLVSAVNENLSDEAMRGRLSGYEIEMPKLRDRVDDMPLLVNHFLQNYADNPVDEYRFPVAFWCKSQIKGMTSNVRTLENLIRRQVYHFTNLELPSQTRLKAALRAVDLAKKDGLNPPLSLRKLAERIFWNGKMGISYSMEGDWREVVDELRKQGILNPGKK